ncbi:MAG: M13 family metallopeptidase [Flavipsychrobacter sp.]|nr:M13 family metallopeptidase [Flavipsychrobacter sp.]
MMKWSCTLGLALLAGLQSCKPTTGQSPKEDVLIRNRDTTVSPADDFFEYANGGWIKSNPIPDDKTSWGIGSVIQDTLFIRLRSINEDAARATNPDLTTRQIGDFWHSGMDSVNIEKQGLAPLKEELERINALKNPADVMAQAARMHSYGVGVFFDDGVYQDAKNSEVNAYYLSQGGLGLPNRDYYFNTDARTRKIREEYPGYLARMLVLMNVPQQEATRKAQAVLAMETRLAKASRKLEDLRDPYANYNKIAIARLRDVAPSTDWALHLQQMGVKNIDSVIVGQPEFYKELDKVIGTTDLQTLKDYMSLQLVSSFAEYLSTPFFSAEFDFYNRTIRGQKQPSPRWKRVLAAEEDAMGESLGKLFAEEYFDKKAKKRYEDIVENVRDAYKARIEKLDWMTAETKQKALKKLASISKKVGYPDKWKDFSSMKIDRGAYAGNILRSRQWWNDYQLSKLGKPVDRNEWDMTPQTYNAYYNPSNNEIVLPAGIFTVPGYRDEELDDALVYGYAAASTVGHEITHGFDDEGRQYDDKGNLQNWWTDKDEQEFSKRADVLVQQFNAFMPLDTQRINGKATLGENLADLGGILIGLDAFKMTKAYKDGKSINGLTPLQRYFLGYALGWLYHQRNEELATRLLTDVHSPAKYRVNGPFPNVPEFYEAFQVKPGDKMYLPEEKRVKLW